MRQRKPACLTAWEMMKETYRPTKTDCYPTEIMIEKHLEVIKYNSKSFV